MEKHNSESLKNICINGQSGPDEVHNPTAQNENRKETDPKLSFREKWREPAFREKCVYSMFMTTAFVAIGLFQGQHGPTFLDVQIITHTDMETASAFFTGGNTGSMVGNIIAGLVFSKVNTPLLVFMTTVCTGLTNILIPYCTQFELMIFIRFVSAAFAGGLSTTLNTEHLAVWGSDGNGVLQGLHFCFSLGGVISPLIAEPFLVEKSSWHENTTANNGSSQYSNTSTSQSAAESKVEYVFLIIGIYIMIVSIPFLFIFIKRGNKVNKNVKNRKFSQRNVPFPTLILMLVGLCLFLTFYVCAEVTYFSFIMAFLVEEYESVSKSKGAFITTIAWASFAVGRFLMIFVTRIVTPLQLIVILITLMTVSLSSFSVCAYFGLVNALIVFGAISGFAMSGVFPAGLAFAEMQLFPVTGVILSSIFVSCALGAILNPLILGFLMENYTNMWFCFLLLIEVCFGYFILIILVLFSKYYVDKKYGSLASTSNRTKTQKIEISNGIDPNDSSNDKEARVKFLQ